jgi:hypothetical protein
MVNQIDNEDFGKKFVNGIHYRLTKNNLNWLAIICGSTGSGKSYSALSIAEQICGSRVIVVFNSLEFMEILNSNTIQRGDIIIYDEAGVGMSSRAWMTVQNKLLGSILQTFRNMNIGVIFTTPELSFIDVMARRLFHAYFQTSHLDRKREIAYLKVYNIESNSLYNKIYYKHPIIKDENNMTHMLTHLGLRKASPELIEMYEAKKLAYTKALNAKVLAEMKGEGQPKSKFNNRVPNKDEIVNDIVANPKDFIRQRFKQGAKDLDPEAIMNKYNIGMPTARAIKKQAEQGLGIGFSLRGSP